MIDRHYYVRPDQDEQLRTLASRLGARPAALVREGIDLVIQKHRKAGDWLAETKKIRGLLKDDDGIETRLKEARESLDRPVDFSTQ